MDSLFFKKLNSGIMVLWFVLVFLFCSLINSSALSQEIDIKKQFYETEINNVKILYTKGDMAGAFKRLLKLEQRFPKDALIKYMLSILYFSYREDLTQAKKYFRQAQKLNRKFDLPPRELTPEKLKEIFLPRNISNTNAKIVIAEIEKSIKRNKWDVAELNLINGKKYFDEADPNIQAIYYLEGLRIYDKKKNEIRSLYYFKKIKEEHLSKEYQRQLEHYEEKYNKKWENFRKLYSSNITLSNAIADFLKNKKIDDLFFFLDLCSNIYQHNREIEFFLDLKRLEAFLKIRDLGRAQKLYNTLRLKKINIQTPGYLATFDRLYSDLLILRAERKIQLEKSRADSLMLKGLYDEGMAIYNSILEEQKRNKLTSKFGIELTYFSLAKIHKDLGEYNTAREYLEKIKNVKELQQRVSSLSDSIVKAELFEITWQKKIQEAKKYWAEGEYDRVINTISPLVRSPYLRYGMKFETYNLLADALLKKGYFFWAKHLKFMAMRYPIYDKTLSLSDIKNKLQPEYQEQRFYIKPHSYNLKYPLKIKYYRNVEFLLTKRSSSDYLGNKNNVGYTSKFMSYSEFPVRCSGVYSIEFKEKQINTNILVGAGILTMNGLMMLSR